MDGTAGKYHINAKGDPEKCTATVRPCPYGATGHYSTPGEAKVAMERIWKDKILGEGNTPALSKKNNNGSNGAEARQSDDDGKRPDNGEPYYTKDLKPIQGFIDRYDTGLIKDIKEYAASYYYVEDKMLRAWKAKGLDEVRFYTSDQLTRHEKKYGAYGRLAVRKNMDAVEAKIREDRKKQLSYIREQCDEIGGIKKAKWCPGKDGDIEGWIHGNDGRKLNVQAFILDDGPVFICKIWR